MYSWPAGWHNTAPAADRSRGSTAPSILRCVLCAAHPALRPEMLLYAAFGAAMRPRPVLQATNTAYGRHISAHTHT